MAIVTSVTLQNLLTNVRTLLSSPDPSNSFWTDRELIEYINEAVRVYFVEAVHANEGYFTIQTGGSVADLNIVANQETVALPTDCFQVKNVWKKVTNGWLVLPYRNTMTEGYSNQGGTSSESYIPFYYFQGNNLVLRPTPNFSETGGIRLEYIQFPDTMIYGGDQMTNQVSPVFKQLIEIYACYKAKLRESMVNGVIVHKVPEENLTALYAQFKSIIEKRSKNPTYVIAYNPETENS